MMATWEIVEFLVRLSEILLVSVSPSPIPVIKSTTTTKQASIFITQPSHALRHEDLPYHSRTQHPASILQRAS